MCVYVFVCVRAIAITLGEGSQLMAIEFAEKFKHIPPAAHRTLQSIQARQEKVLERPLTVL